MTTSHIEFAQTRDGSWTCFNTELQEHYHNLSGAYTEAQNIYIRPAALDERFQTTEHLVVLDPFLGLGYNTLALMDAFTQLRESSHPNACLTILAVEMDPQILAHIPHAIKNCGQDDLKQFLTLFEHNIYYQTQFDLSDLLQTRTNTPIEGLSLHTLVGDIRHILPTLPEYTFDLIFHDAFSPRKQPELWTAQLFQHYRRILKAETGEVFTYSAAAPVRKALMDTGFHVYLLPIPDYKPGTIATQRPNASRTVLSSLEDTLIHCKSGIPYEDTPSLTLSRETIARERLQRQQISELSSSSAIHRQFGYFKHMPPQS